MKYIIRLAVLSAATVIHDYEPALTAYQQLSRCFTGYYLW